MVNTQATQALAAWVVTGGLSGMAEPDLLDGFCERCRGAGIPLSRALVIIDTLHPIHEGRAFRWQDTGFEEARAVEYGRTDEGEAAEMWRRSVFFQMREDSVDEGIHDLRQLDDLPYYQFDAMARDGHVSLLALVQRFATAGTIGEMDCVYSNWCTREPDGFAPAALDALRGLVPVLALAIKSVSLARIAETLVETYLGRDAGRRVLGGGIQRGVAEPISAVLWFSDLRGFTRITETEPAEAIIPLLNDYADAVISAVTGAGGDVLKLLGDGVLAIFKADDPERACRGALDAEADLRARVRALNARRARDGAAATSVYLGLHIGEVWYGNVGSADRLDFTVVGRAVNEAARIAAMCRSADRDVLLSAEFLAAAAAADRARCVAVGRYAFRGLRGARDLFTLEETESGPPAAG